MTDRISVEEYRRLVGAPLPHQRAIIQNIVQPERGKAHHTLGRLAPGKMNKTEARYERELLAPAKGRGELLWYAFEAVKLRLADRTFLTVDFAVLTKDGVLELHDVKGALAIVEEDAKVKMKVAAAMFPFRFKMAFPRPRKLGGGWMVREVGK